MKLVLDTNVVVTAFRSRHGASNVLLRMALERRFSLLCSTALFLEYEAVLSRDEVLAPTSLTRSDVGIIVDTLAKLATPVEMSFRFRPMLKDSDDEMVLETALNGGAGAIVTHNVKDFGPALSWGLEIVRPGEIVRRLKDE